MKTTRLVLAALAVSTAPSRVQAARRKTPKAAKSKSGSKSGKGTGAAPALYIMTNAASGNEVRMHARDPATGSLEYLASFATGGVGAGIASSADPSVLNGHSNPLGSSEPLIDTGTCVLAANAGSASVTSFVVMPNGYLVRAGVYPTGDFPNSVAHEGGVVYVLGAGGEGSLSGFQIDASSCLLKSVGPAVSLGQQGESSPPVAATAPAQVEFVTVGGKTFLAVKISGQDNVVGPGTMSLYPLAADGALGAPAVTTLKVVPFSFDVHAAGIVSNAAGDQTVTNYAVADDGSLTVAGGPVDLGGVTGNCWIQASTKNGCVATTNFNGGDGTVAVLRLGADDGALTLLDNAAARVGGPIDLRFDPAGEHLYVLGGGRPAVYVYAVAEDCALDEMQVLGTVPFEFTTFGVVGMALRRGADE